MPPGQKGGRSWTRFNDSGVEQGENAQQPTTQSVEEEVWREFDPFIYRAGKSNAEGAETQRPQRAGTDGRDVPRGTVQGVAGSGPDWRAPSEWRERPLREAIKRRTETTLGAAQKDTSRELAAKFANMRPVQWVGIALLIGAGALFYFGWPTPALIAAAGGIGMIAMAHAIVGNERLLVVAAVIALAILLVFRAYERGKLDSLLPEALDRGAKADFKSQISDFRLQVPDPQSRGGESGAGKSNTESSGTQGAQR